MRIFITDGGARAEGMIRGDENDCMVVALAMCLGLRYSKALEMLDSAGRRRGEGFDVVSFFEHCGFNNVETEAVNLPKKGLRISEFIEEFRTGSYIIYTKGHVLSVIDGLIFSNSLEDKPTKKVRYAWKLKSKS